MKPKYRVETDCLEWLGVTKNKELYKQVDEEENVWYEVQDSKTDFTERDIDQILEHHPDWLTEIKEPILVTADNVEVWDPDQYVHGLRECNCVSAGKCTVDKALGYSGYIWFSTQKARDEYIEQNKKVFSRVDIEQLQNRVHKIVGDGEVMQEFNKLFGVNAC